MYLNLQRSNFVCHNFFMSFKHLLITVFVDNIEA